MPQFYRDLGMPEVERLAKAAARARGMQDDTMVPETGYANSEMIPGWWKYQDAALNYIAMRDADKMLSCG